jgi:hypothetical protein
MAKKDHNFTYEQMEEMPYAKIKLNKTGEERRVYHKKGVWELDITSLVQAIDPADYFCTTGEAVIKTRKLEADLFAAAGIARKLGNLLRKLRGEDIYLETQWIGGKLLLKAKNPRKNKEEKARALEENFEHGRKTT